MLRDGFWLRHSTQDHSMISSRSVIGKIEKVTALIYLMLPLGNDCATQPLLQ